MASEEQDPGRATPLHAQLQRVAEAGGCLLRVERAPRTGPAGARLSERLRLTFDVGALDACVSGGQLQPSPPDASEPLLNADEDDPWWALLGHPLTKVAPHEEAGLLVQFRADDASPKILILAPEAGAVAVRPVV
ncbi:MAG: hypothetical protein QF410_10045 [Planctomycetota bacterium]|jgi:hypothetical protein|nr:hypothetical protein [Deltaproteobacteria bacterium]MDP6539870.1 hypothetical protein [Planctomycetota bacterium]